MSLKKERIIPIAGAAVAVLLLAGGIYLLTGDNADTPTPVVPVVEEVIVAPVTLPVEPAEPSEPAKKMEPEREPQSIEYTNQDELADDITRIVIQESETDQSGTLDELLDGKVIIHNEVVGKDGKPVTNDSEK